MSQKLIFGKPVQDSTGDPIDKLLALPWWLRLILFVVGWVHVVTNMPVVAGFIPGGWLELPEWMITPIQIAVALETILWLCLVVVLLVVTPALWLLSAEAFVRRRLSRQKSLALRL